jgi:hypothetical protein
VRWYSRLRSGCSLCLGRQSTVWLWLCPGPANTAVAARAARAMPILQLYIMSSCQIDSRVIIVTSVCVLSRRSTACYVGHLCLVVLSTYACTAGMHKCCALLCGAPVHTSQVCTGAVPRSRRGPAVVPRLSACCCSSGASCRCVHVESSRVSAAAAAGTVSTADCDPLCHAVLFGGLLELVWLMQHLLLLQVG